MGVEEKVGGDETRQSAILVIDDNEQFLRLMTRILSKEGYAISAATDGYKGLQLSREQEFDVIICDLKMPGMGGIELLRLVRERNLDVPMIIVTGMPSFESAVSAMELGVSKLLLKPVDATELKEAVSRAIKLHRLAQIKQAALDMLGERTPLVSDRAGLEVTFKKGVDALWMAYQPIVNAPSNEVVAYEALLRTREEAIAHPGAFFDIAERLDLLFELGRAIRRAVAHDLTSAPEGVEVFVNLHPRDLHDEELFSESAPLSAFAPRCVLEITERASLGHESYVTRKIGELKKMGYRIAIDDLGAGYSGLSSLASLHPEVAKIDMSLIRDINADQAKRALVRSLVEACEELGMMVVTEGIETDAERNTLLEIGSKVMQGYLFGKPAPQSETLCR